MYSYIENYEEIQDYKVYLCEDGMVIIFTETLFQGLEGYVVTDKQLEQTLEIEGLGVDGNRLNILSKENEENVYLFSAGL